MAGSPGRRGPGGGAAIATTKDRHDIIEVPAGLYQLTIPGSLEFAGLQGDLNLIGDVEIHGALNGQTAIQSAVADRVFQAQAPPGMPSTIRLTDLVITGGQIDAGGGIFGENLFLTMERITVSGNTASALGGIHLGVSDLALIDSTISGNTVTQGTGGGISIFCLINAPCTASITNSTISGNSTSAAAGGILNDGASLTIVDSTIVNNSASNGTAFSLFLAARSFSFSAL